MYLQACHYYFSLLLHCYDAELHVTCSAECLVAVKPVWTPVAILGSFGVCIYAPASRHWLISYSSIHLT